MQYGPVPTNIFERLALWSGKVPVPLMDALFSIMKARGLMAAVRLGIFEALAKQAGTAAELAGKLALDRDSLEMLLRALADAGYLDMAGNRFSLSRLSRSTMVEGAEMELSGFLKWN